MSFANRSDFTTAAASEKLTLAWVEGVERLHLWTLDSGSIYKRSVSHFVVGVHAATTVLAQVASVGAMTAGTWYYDSALNELYVWTAGSTNPQTAEEMIVTYRFFYGSGPIAATWDLEDTSEHVHYEGRIQLSPNFKHKVGIEQDLVSLIGNGTLKLHNNDGALDELFDTIIFENKPVTIFSWNRDLDFSDAKVIFRGVVTNKRFQNDNVAFLVKDELFKLEQEVPQTPYDDDDNVNDDVKGTYKRWVYGRVDGLKLQSIDQIGGGYTITGTGAMGVDSAVLTGTGTTFLADVSPGDTIRADTQEFTIETVDSDTQLTMDDDAVYSFTATTLVLSPEIPTVNKNRDYFVTGHACTTLSTTVVKVIQFNRVQLADTTGLSAGDFLEFTTGERKEIKNIAPGNIAVLRDNLILIPSVSSTVLRQPVQSIFIEGKDVRPEQFTITNTTTEMKVTLNADAEFELARTINFGFDATFTNGTRSITTTDDVDLRETLSPRDYIRPQDLTYTTFYEILEVKEKEVIIRTNFTDPTITDPTEGRKPNYVGDETIVSADVLGRTVDGTTTGTWIRTAAQAIRDLITEAGLTNVNETSFTTGAVESSHLISIALPLSPTDGAITIKDTVDALTRSTFSAVTLDNDLKIKYKVLEIQIPDTFTEIDDSDVVDWSIQTSNGKNIRNTIIRYRHTDISRANLEAGSNVTTYDNPFVEKYVGTNKTQELDVYLYETFSAKTMSHRLSYWNSLSRADLKLSTDLRLENLEIGDTIVVNFRRLYKRFGDAASRKKAMTVVGKTVNGERTTLELSDLGNLFNRSSVITPNAAPDFTAATEDEKLKYGYITENNGIVDDDEGTAGVHLIS